MKFVNLPFLKTCDKIRDKHVDTNIYRFVCVNMIQVPCYNDQQFMSYMIQEKHCNLVFK